MGVYPVLRAAEDGRGVVIALVARAVAANTEGGTGLRLVHRRTSGPRALQGEERPLRVPGTTRLASASLHWGYPGSSTL